MCTCYVTENVRRTWYVLDVLLRMYACYVTEDVLDMSVMCY